MSIYIYRFHEEQLHKPNLKRSSFSQCYFVYDIESTHNIYSVNRYLVKTEGFECQTPYHHFIYQPILQTGLFSIQITSIIYHKLLAKSSLKQCYFVYDIKSVQKCMTLTDIWYRLKTSSANVIVIIKYYLGSNNLSLSRFLPKPQ